MPNGDANREGVPPVQAQPRKSGALPATQVSGMALLRGVRRGQLREGEAGRELGPRSPALGLELLRASQSRPSVGGRIACVTLISIALAGTVSTRVDATYRGCGAVTISANSGDVLFAVRAEHISCSRARSTLRRWGKAGYLPRSGPRGWRCRTVETFVAGNTRKSCRRREARILFTTGV